MAQTFAEIGRVEAIRQLFEGTGYQPFGEPLWLEAQPQECITSASGLLLEGIDFDLVYFPLKHLGRKAVLKVTGELYAVLARPEALSVQLGVSAKLDFPQVQELWSGIEAINACIQAAIEASTEDDIVDRIPYNEFRQY